MIVNHNNNYDYCYNFQHEKLSTMVFKHHIYLEKEELFHSYGIGDEEAEFIKELIDHELPSDVSTTKKRKQLQKPKRLFLYEVAI